MAVSAAQRQARFEDLYRAEAAAVLSYVARRTGSDHAEDLVADVFAVAWRRFEDVPQDHARAWLLAVARKTFANHFRSGRRTQQVGIDDDLPDAYDLAASTTARTDVERALSRLRPADREVVELVAWHDLSQAEAARVLGCTRAAFAVRLHRARQRLRQALDQPEPTPTPVTCKEAQ